MGAAAVLVALSAWGADIYLGGKTKVTSMHPATNNFLVLMGDHAGAVYRAISPSNLVDVLKAMPTFPLNTSNYVDGSVTFPKTTGVQGGSSVLSNIVNSGAITNVYDTANDGVALTNGIQNSRAAIKRLINGANVTLTDQGSNIVISATGGSGSPGGSTTQIQYNNASSFDGASGFVIPASQGETNANLTGLLNLFRLVVTNYADIAQLWDGASASKALTFAVTGTDPVLHASVSTLTLSNADFSVLSSMNVGGDFGVTGSTELSGTLSVNGSLSAGAGIDVSAGSVTAPSFVASGSTAGLVELADSDGDKHVRLVAPGTVNTNGNYILPAEPRNGFVRSTLSQGTNGTLSIDEMPLQKGDNVLSNLVGTVANNVTNVAQGWGVHLSTATGTLTARATNALTLMATNATTFQADFTGGTPLIQTADFMRTNVTLQLTNPIVGRVMTFHFRGDGNAVDRTVTVSTNGLTGNWPISWGWNSPTNGATAFTVTNNIGAEASFLVLSNRFSAFWQPVR